MHFDYCFPRNRVGGEYIVVLVGRDRESRVTFSHVVPIKGGELDWISEQVARDILRIGHHGDLILLSDQEPAIIDLLNRVAKLRGEGRTHLEQSPVGDSRANGVAERAVQTIEKLLRVHKLALEDRLGEPIPVQHQLVGWLVEHVADVYNRTAIGTDGKTAIQRLKGKACSGHMVPFGASIMFRVCGKVDGGSLTERWHAGKWVGKRMGTEEHFVMAMDGKVVRARAIREFDEKVALKDFDVLVSTPHDPTGTIRSAMRDTGRQQGDKDGAEEQEPHDERATPKRVQITREVILKFGPTADCRKCWGVMANDKSYQYVHHSEQCRARLERLMRDHDEFREHLERAEHRRTQRLADILEQRDKRQRVQEKMDRKRKADQMDSDTTVSSPGGVSSGLLRDSDGKEIIEKPIEIKDDGDVAMGDQDELGVPLATTGTTTGLKRGSDTQDRPGEDVEPAVVRQRREGVKRETNGEHDLAADIHRQMLDHLTCDVGVKAVNQECAYDFCEIFSSPRVCKIAEEVGMRGGYSLDVSWRDEVTGRSWNFLEEANQHRLWGLLKKSRPRLLVASPPCTTFSSLQNLRKTSMPDADRRQGLALLEVAVKACRLQHRAGHYFMLEHPLTASSWREQCVRDLLKVDGVFTVVLDQCEYGLIRCDEYGEGRAKKGIRVITNLSHARVTLTKRCSGGHRHVHLLHGRAKKAQEYPRALYMAMVEALRLAKSDEQELNTLDAEIVHIDELHDDIGNQYEEHFVENSGKPLDPAKVRRGREKEMRKLHERDTYEYVLRETARANKEGKFVETRWVEVENGDEVRCRLVAQEFAAGDPRTDLFAGTPPLFAARLLVALAAVLRVRQWSLMALDVTCAFLYAPCVRELFIELPADDPKSKTGKYVGKLKKALYGTRDAPQLWLSELKRTLEMLGFKSSLLFPCVYWHDAKQIMIVAHVDDLLVGGVPSDLRWLRTELKKTYDIKGEILDHSQNSIKFLGRRIRGTEAGYTWTADPKHVEMLVKDFDLQTANGVGIPVGPEDRPDGDRTRPEMDAMAAKKYRAGTARVNYLANDRPDLAVAANLLSRSMATPRIGDEKLLKRTVRYLKAHPECEIVYEWEEMPSELRVMTDSDWAGCKTTRRSTSGMVVLLGKHLILSACKLQKSVALSSGEAELNAQVAGVAEGFGVKRLLEAFGFQLGMTSCCDSSAARGVLTRVGSGRIRHLEVKHLWVQELVTRKVLRIVWIPRTRNPADVLTHSTSQTEFWRLLGLLGIRVTDGPLQGLSEGGCWRFIPALTYFSVPRSYSLGLL